MRADWQESSIGEHVDLATGEAFQSARFRTTADSGTLLARGDNIKEGRFEWGDKARYWPELTPQLEKYLLREGDVLVGMDGSKVGKNWVQVRRKDLPCLLVQRVARLRAKGSMDQGFLRYLIGNPKFSSFVDRIKTGTSIPHVSGGQIKSYEVLLPPIAEQKAIAAMLGALDDKIELNRRMNATLEAMARALFQSWFVGFDPVRAKIDRHHSTSLEPTTAALFPNEFEDSELGPIPRGWYIAKIADIGEVICGKTPPTAVPHYYGNDIPFITIPDMHGNVFATSTARKLSVAGANSQANKTLPAGSICVSCIATPGLVVITFEKSQTNQQINSVVPRERDETYFWYWAMKGLGAEIASGGSGGSVLTNLSKGRFEALQVIKPPHTVIQAYHLAVRPIFEKILANVREIETLGELRDALLPRLLSGELQPPMR